MDQEIISLGLSLPIMDWGLGKGRVKTAKSRENVVRTQTDQEDTEHRQDIMIKVVQFNNQIRQCKISAMADSVAEQRYEMVMERFINGTADVTDLNTAQSEKDEAANRYIQELNNYWSYYYNIRRLTLFDYISRTNISAEFDKIVGK
jgi:outer membrane protein